MTRSSMARKSALVGVLAALGLAFSGPAQAADFQVTTGSATCNFSAYGTSYSAYALVGGCYKVQARATYIAANGTSQLSTGTASTSKSTASTPTSMITKREAHGSINTGGTVLWSIYGSY